MNIYDQNFCIDNLDEALAMIEIAKDKISHAESRIDMIRKKIYDLPVPKETQ